MEHSPITDYCFLQFFISRNMETIASTDIYFTLFAVTLLILLLTVCMIFFFVVYRKNLFRKQLQLERNESEHRLALLQTVINTTEQERRRIAGDLHDEIGSHLSTVRLTLNNIRSQSQGLEHLYILAEDGKKIIDETIESVRSISYNLLPPGLEKFGLINTLSDLCEKVSKNSTLKTVLTADATLKIHTATELMVYRIFQELLNNTLKHAEATNVDAVITQDKKELTIQYSDDGKGIEWNDKSSKNSLGLKNIEGRIAALKGYYTLQNDNQKGFYIKIRIPADND
jgi:signal transduction histidine kinase